MVEIIYNAATNSDVVGISDIIGVLKEPVKGIALGMEMSSEKTFLCRFKYLNNLFYPTEKLVRASVDANDDLYLDVEDSRGVVTRYQIRQWKIGVSEKKQKEVMDMWEKECTMHGIITHTKPLGIKTQRGVHKRMTSN